MLPTTKAAAAWTFSMTCTTGWAATPTNRSVPPRSRRSCASSASSMYEVSHVRSRSVCSVRAAMNSSIAGRRVEPRNIPAESRVAKEHVDALNSIPHRRAALRACTAGRRQEGIMVGRSRWMQAGAKRLLRAGVLGAAVVGLAATAVIGAPRNSLRIEEASIADIHRAMLGRQLTATQLVNEYLKRIAAYNGTCVKGAVDSASGLQLGDIEPIEHAGKLNALIT